MANPKAAQTSSPDEVPHGIELLSAHLCDIKVVLEKMEEQMIERNALLRGSEQVVGNAEVPQSRDVLDRLERLEANIPARLDEIIASVATIPGLIGKLDKRIVGLERLAGVGLEVQSEEAKMHAIERDSTLPPAPAILPTKRGRGRPPKPENCKHENVETLENGLRRCLKCGAVLEAALTPAEEKAIEKVVAEVKAEPSPLAQAVMQKLAEKVEPKIEEKPADPEAAIRAFIESNPGVKPAALIRTFKISFNRAEAYIEAWGVAPEPTKVEEPKPEPAEEPKVEEKPVDINDVRAVAIAYANKHGKDKLGEVLKKYGQGNLSSVPVEQYRTLMLDLSNGSK